MMTRVHITALLGTAAAAWAALLLLQGQPLRWALINPFSGVVSVLVGLLWLYDRYLWRIWPFHALFGAPAIVAGTWEGTLSPAPTSSQDGTIPAKNVTLVATQRASTLRLELHSDQGKSVTLVVSECTENDGLRRIVGLYRHTPTHEVRDASKNQIHYGAVLLELDDPRNVQKLTGYFFTDKSPATAGKIELVRKGARKGRRR